MRDQPSKRARATDLPVARRQDVTAASVDRAFKDTQNWVDQVFARLRAERARRR